MTIETRPRTPLSLPWKIGVLAAVLVAAAWLFLARHPAQYRAIAPAVNVAREILLVVIGVAMLSIVVGGLVSWTRDLVADLRKRI